MLCAFELLGLSFRNLILEFTCVTEPLQSNKLHGLWRNLKSLKGHSAYMEINLSQLAKVCCLRCQTDFRERRSVYNKKGRRRRQLLYLFQENK